jgi:hypothetical protein
MGGLTTGGSKHPQTAAWEGRGQTENERKTETP